MGGFSPKTLYDVIVVQAEFEEARSDQLARIVRWQATTKERALRIEGEQEPVPNEVATSYS
jgi:hypothetical protein